MERKLRKRQVRKMYMDNLKTWNPPATEEEIKQQMELADMSYAENEGVK